MWIRFHGCFGSCRYGCLNLFKNQRCTIWQLSFAYSFYVFLGGHSHGVIEQHEHGNDHSSEHHFGMENHHGHSHEDGHEDGDEDRDEIQGEDED